LLTAAGKEHCQSKKEGGVRKKAVTPKSEAASRREKADVAKGLRAKPRKSALGATGDATTKSVDDCRRLSTTIGDSLLKSVDDCRRLSTTTGDPLLKSVDDCRRLSTTIGDSLLKSVDDCR